MDSQDKVPFKQIIRNFLVELIVYGVLLVVYYYLALRFLGEPLAELFQDNLVVYAFAGLGLIVTQAVVLEFVVSFLFDFLGLHRLTNK